MNQFYKSGIHIEDGVYALSVELDEKRNRLGRVPHEPVPFRYCTNDLLREIDDEGRSRCIVVALESVTHFGNS